MSNLDDISANSDSAREANEAEESRDKDYVPMEKVSVLAKFLGIFGIETDFGGAAGSVWEDVIKPTFLDGCRDSMYALADYFFGGGGGSASRNRSSKKGHTDYSNKYRGDRANKGKSPNQAAYYILFEDRTQALEVLDKMWDVVGQCEFCSVQDFLTICGKKTSNYTLGDWGWYSGDLKGVRAVRTGEGDFCLNLPKPRAAKDD